MSPANLERLPSHAPPAYCKCSKLPACMKAQKEIQLEAFADAKAGIICTNSRSTDRRAHLSASPGTEGRRPRDRSLQTAESLVRINATTGQFRCLNRTDHFLRVAWDRPAVLATQQVVLLYDCRTVVPRCTGYLYLTASRQGFVAGSRTATTPLSGCSVSLKLIASVRS